MSVAGSSRTATPRTAGTRRAHPQAEERLSAIGKVAAIVGTLATDNRLSSIARTVGLPTSTVHRILQELVDVGWVRDDGEHGYLVGARLLAIISRANDDTTLLSVARPILRDLRDTTGHTVHLAMRQGDEAVYIEKLDGRRSYQMRSHVGLTIPLHCTAIGKALMAEMPADEVRAIVKRTGLARHTEHTITRLDQLLGHLDTIRRRGFAFDEEENELHIHCVGAAVVDRRGVPVAGVSVSSLSFDIDEPRMRRHSELVVAAAHQIAHALGA
ncbi:MAG: IclR family transcriptional regulator [Actinomycetes bacterium]